MAEPVDADKGGQGTKGAGTGGEGTGAGGGEGEGGGGRTGVRSDRGEQGEG